MTNFFVLSFLLSLFAQADFFKIQIDDLKVAPEAREALNRSMVDRRWNRGMESRVPIPRFKTFAWVVWDLEEEEGRLENRMIKEAWLIVELASVTGEKGFLDYWNSDEDRWDTIACELDPGKLTKCHGEELAYVRSWNAEHQLSVGSRGGLWYRSQVLQEVRERRDFRFDGTFETLSGGRALAENLALDRELILGRGEKDGKVAISSIKGVTVEPIPWEEWMPEEEIPVDFLARKVPEDQYLMVVPSLKSLFGLMDRVEETGTPILQSFAVGDQYRNLPARYRTQMGLDLPGALARLLPVGSVAVTGGDPFFPTGSDVAVLLETDKEDFVYSSLKSTLAGKAKLAGADEMGDGNTVGFQNETRSFSAHLVKLDGAVVVSNSAHQIARLRAVAGGKIHALGDTDEYRFFRHRYPMGKDESAYVFISDACLRSWAGPAVRIGASRRSRALSALGTITSRQLEKGELDQSFEPLLGTVSQAGERVLSPNYGTLGFLTPIGELGFTEVTIMEKESYERWRRGYENGWARFFDPIAIRLQLGENREEMDMTILPLRVDSDYQDVISLAGKAVLSQASQTVPQESAFHFAMALDHDSELFREANVGLVDLLPSLSINPLSWMGQSFSVTLGDSLAWRGEFDGETLKELPVLVRVDVESRLKLALFMTAMKGTLEASSPELVSWETREHGDRKYVAVIGDADELGADVSIYYATLPTGLLVSLNEDMLKRALDREKEVVKGRNGKGQIFAQTTPGFLAAAGEMERGLTLDDRRRALSYRALPILNEWYKSREAGDPVAFHNEKFATVITCPGGKGFRWNEEDLTMESVAYGHQGRRLVEARPLKILDRFKSIEMRAEFEEGGMRVAMALDEKSQFKSPPVTGAPRPVDDQIVAIADLYPNVAGMVLKFESQSSFGFDQEREKETMEARVDEVMTKGGVTVVKETCRIVSEDEERIEKWETEIGPKGLRILAMEGEGKMAADPKGYDFPEELWPGQIFRVRKQESWIEKAGEIRMLSDHVVKVVGWETITGPDGKDLKALRLERDASSLRGRDYNRYIESEWYARGLGLVKCEYRSGRDRGTTVLVEVVMPD